MSSNISLNTTDLVRYGVEGVACIGIGTYAFSSLSTACIFYGVGKGTQIAMRVLLSAVPNLSDDAKSIVTWGVTLLASSAPLHVAVSEAAGKSTSALSTLVNTFALGVASVGLGKYAANSFSSSLTPPPQSAPKNIPPTATQST